MKMITHRVELMKLRTAQSKLRDLLQKLRTEYLAANAN